eukprot:11190033-Lingulodinium_polyedra.AAC.1
MVFAWSARSAEMRGAAALQCIRERISEQFSRESCSETHSRMHSNVVARRIFVKRAHHANTKKWCSHGARVWRTCAAQQRWNAFANAFLSSSCARAAQKR